MSDRREVELKPCPFCGGEASKHLLPATMSHGTLWQVECSRRCCSTIYRTNAVEVWNTRSARPLPSGDLREAVVREAAELLLDWDNRGYFNVKQSEALRVVLAHVTDWVEITDVASLPQEGGQYLWRFRTVRSNTEFKAEYYVGGVPATYYVDWFSHYKRITPPRITE